MVVPMLDEVEWADVHAAYRRGWRLRGVSQDALWDDALALYEARTGFRETSINAVLHHRPSLYGPPCRACGKPLRTPQARFCASCWTPRAAEDSTDAGIGAAGEAV